MDFHIQIGDKEVTFTQFHDMVGYIKQHLAQWSSFEDVSKPQIIMISKVPNNVPTLGISTSETMELWDIWGGLPDKWTEEQKSTYLHWSDEQKDLYWKLIKMAEEQGEEALSNYLRNQGK